MTRGTLSKRIPDHDAIRLFAEHHIVQVRRRKNGEILAIKHASWGWISPKSYYVMQEMHRLLPTIVEGGYRAKSLLWGISAEVTVLGTTASLPLGMFFPLIEFAALNEAINAGNWQNALFWGFALLGPFGDVLAVKGILDFLFKPGQVPIIGGYLGSKPGEAAPGQPGGPPLEGDFWHGFFKPLFG